MWVYNVSDLFDRLKDLKDDGFDYVELHFLEPDSDDDVPCICFEGVTSKCSSVDYEDVEAISLPPDYYLNK